MLGLNFIFEVIRNNTDPARRASGILAFTMLDISTTATLLGVVGGLFFARLQWSRANRPYISYAILDDNAEFSANSTKWTVFIQNSGPGTAIAEQFRYVVQFTGEPMSVPITLDEINTAMKSRGLVDGLDYFVREQGRGAAYAPTNTPEGWTKICWFTVKALAELEKIDIVIQVRDGMGDRHERRLVIADKMPSVAKAARAAYLEQKSPNGATRR
jgi:hypothetical protein